MFRHKETTSVSSPQKKRKGFLNEKGNMLVWYVMMFPVFIGAVALAVDVTNIAAVRASLQVSADAATQGAVSMSQNQANGKPRYVSTVDAKNQAIMLYDANRSGMSKAGRYKEGIPFLKCQTSSTGNGSLVTPSNSHCGFTMVSFEYSPDGGLKKGGYLTMTVQEKADTMFMQFLGLDDLTYTITSTARLTNSYN